MIKLILKTLIILLNIASFILVHFSFKFVMKYPQGWNRITTYSVGVFFNYPFFISHILNGESPENAYMLSFLSSGAGTVAGWMLEDVES